MIIIYLTYLFNYFYLNIYNGVQFLKNRVKL